MCREGWRQSQRTRGEQQQKETGESAAASRGESWKERVPTAERTRVGGEMSTPVWEFRLARGGLEKQWWWSPGCSRLKSEQKNSLLCREGFRWKRGRRNRAAWRRNKLWHIRKGWRRPAGSGEEDGGKDEHTIGRGEWGRTGWKTCVEGEGEGPVCIRGREGYWRRMHTSLFEVEGVSQDGFHLLTETEEQVVCWQWKGQK